MTRFLDRIFLLRRETDPSWPVWKKSSYYIWRALLLLAAGVCMGALVLLLAVGTFPREVLYGYLESWDTIVLNIAPVVVLVLAAYALLGRAWAGFFLGGLAAFGLSLGNFFKIEFRDDPLLFEDMFNLREASAMADGGHYDLFVNTRMILIAACLLAGTLLLALLARGRLRWKQRLVPLAAAALSCAALLPFYNDVDRYEAVDNFEHLERWSDTENYIAHGFFYPFVYSIREFIEIPPSGYSKEKAEALLAAYPDEDIPADRKINLIVLMREAYADFSQYGIPGLDTSGYALYHQLEAESYTGNLVTNIFAGGTVDTERCVLTGDYRLHNFRHNVNSYAWYLRTQGYTAEGSHPYHQWFYNRQNINAYMGLERYRFMEGDFENMTDTVYPEDSYLLPEIYGDFQKNKATGKPYFSFSVNVQSHGPYATWDMGVEELLAGDYSRECRKAITNYLDVIWKTDEELAKLLDRLREDEEPVVLVTFGDHLPWMGDNKAFYEEMGVNLDLGTEEGFFTHYSTRYLIWANDAARAVLGRDVRGEGPAISPCYLMNLVFGQLGWEGPGFMQAMDGMMEVFPIVTTTGWTMTDGVLSGNVPEERKELHDKFLYLQHYWRNEFLYKNVREPQSAMGT